MKSIFALLFTLLLILTSSIAVLDAQAAFIFNNFDYEDSYHPEWYYAVSYSISHPFFQFDIDTAMAFTPDGNNFFLDTIEVAMSERGGDNELDVWLMNDAGGEPGTIMEAFHFSDTVPQYPGVYPSLVASSVSHPILFSDTQYWVVTSATGPNDTQMDWHFNVIGDIGLLAQRDLLNSGEWNLSTNERAAFRVSGSPVPILGAFWLLSSGLIGLIGLRRKLKN